MCLQCKYLQYQAFGATKNFDKFHDPPYSRNSKNLFINFLKFLDQSERSGLRLKVQFRHFLRHFSENFSI